MTDAKVSKKKKTKKEKAPAPKTRKERQALLKAKHAAAKERN